MNLLSYLANITLVLVATFISFFIIDYLFAVFDPQWSGKNGLAIELTGESYLFQLVPGVSGHNSLGLRGPEIQANKPDDVFRIIVLGDSVTYGLNVDADEAFPALVEKQLEEQRINGKRVEVINAGVPAYTTYNELHFYKDMLRDLSPDLVILGFCMNDVVDPVFHWINREESFLFVPDAAIPNIEFHNQQLRGDVKFVLLSLLPEWSNLKRFLKTLYLRDKTLATAKMTADGSSYPVYLSSEQPLTIDVYNNYESPEWRWLRQQTDDLVKILQEDDTSFLFLIIPLAYQLDSSYPYSPNANFDRFCQESDFDCLDMLVSMAGQPANKLFFTDHGYFEDIWHLTPEGHRLVAHELIEKKINPMFVDGTDKLIR